MHANLLSLETARDHEAQLLKIAARTSVVPPRPQRRRRKRLWMRWRWAPSNARAALEGRG
jgi:hypothetical protein